MSRRDKPALMKILENTPEFKPHEVEVAEEVIDAYLADPGGSGYHIFIAEVDKAVAGYVSYGPTPCTAGTWDLYWIAVDGERRGQGIGKALAAKVDEDIGQAGGRLIMIETSSTPVYDNTRSFYLSRGYRIVGRIPDFYAPGDDMIIMQKRLK
jgi:ribosomal protein S18 acetylase RimI-like enzyme